MSAVQPSYRSSLGGEPATERPDSGISAVSGKEPGCYLQRGSESSSITGRSSANRNSFYRRGVRRHCFRVHFHRASALVCRTSPCAPALSLFQSTKACTTRSQSGDFRGHRGLRLHHLRGSVDRFLACGGSRSGPGFLSMTRMK